MVELTDKANERLRKIVLASQDDAPGYALERPQFVKQLVEDGLIEGNPAITGPFGAIAYRATAAGFSRVEEADAASQPAGEQPAQQWPAAVALAQPEQPALFEGPAQPQPQPQPQIENVPLPAAPAAKPRARTMDDFELEDDVPLPEPVRRTSNGARPELYPFAKMAKGQSFFVPSTEARPKPWLTMRSTISTAIKRFANPAADGSTRKNRQGETVPVLEPTRMFAVYESERENKVTGATEKGARVYRTE